MFLPPVGDELDWSDVAPKPTPPMHPQQPAAPPPPAKRTFIDLHDARQARPCYICAVPATQYTYTERGDVWFMHEWCWLHLERQS